MGNSYDGTAHLPGYPSAELSILADETLHALGKKQRRRGGQALKALLESIDRLHIRLSALSDSEFELSLHASGNRALIPALAGRTGHESQLRFVNTVEAFHQQVYAVLSAVIAVCSTYLPNPMAKQMPLNSVRKWLQWWMDIDTDVVDTANLMRSIELRSSYIDHPQQSRMNDWMTMSVLGRANVIFVRRTDDPGVYARPLGPVDVFSPEVVIPINAVEQLVPPDPRAVATEVLVLSRTVLATCRDQSAGEGEQQDFE